jgi:demethoxyubiquinone hydroxylase (CLK1/Coq7/Cat5 family)
MFIEEASLEFMTVSKREMRSFYLVNIFDSGKMCLGALEGVTGCNWDELSMEFVNRFFDSYWNHHLQNTSKQNRWLTWTMDGAYILPQAEITEYTFTTGTAFSPFIGKGYNG